MTNTTETQSARCTEDADADNKSIVFAALAEAGIHSGTVDYDGSGDSGQIEAIKAWDAVHQKILFSSSRKLKLPSGIPEQSFTEMNLEAAIETLAYDYLAETHGGWGNDDGAFGTFVFSVPDRTITLERNDRYAAYETSTHQF